MIAINLLTTLIQFSSKKLFLIIIIIIIIVSCVNCVLTFPCLLTSSCNKRSKELENFINKVDTNNVLCVEGMGRLLHTQSEPRK